MGQHTLVTEHSLDQDFYSTATRLTPKKPRRNHPCIVKHQQIPWFQEIDNGGKLTVFNRTCGAIKHQ